MQISVLNIKEHYIIFFIYGAAKQEKGLDSTYLVISVAISFVTTFFVLHLTVACIV